MSQGFRVPLVLRGEVVDDARLSFGGRRGEVRFDAPDAAAHLDRLTVRPSAMADLHELSFEDILAFLGDLGPRLKLAGNRYLQEAFELARHTSGLSESILRHHYEMIPEYFRPELVRATADRRIGIDYLDGWVEQPRLSGDAPRVAIRAFGARGVHVIAGNVPVVGVASIIRNAITRSDAVIKTPSNDPLTAAAVARTMIDMAPEHPLTRHLAVAYWKGGDERVEDALYHPARIEKIVAWGGFDSVRHVTRYLQPGIDLITLDPKHSATIIGPEAFATEDTMREVAHRLALDIGGLNQEGCVNARVVYVHSGTGEAGLARLERLGELTYEALQALPEHVSTPHHAFDPELKSEIDGLRLVEEDFRVIDGRSNEGAIIVSREPEPVDFSRLLACRVANLVPIDDIEAAVRSVNAYTQTIGIYPDALKAALRDRLAWQGAQRLVSLGRAVSMSDAGTPQDGIEPLRRMCKWIVDETGEPEA